MFIVNALSKLSGLVDINLIIIFLIMNIILLSLFLPGRILRQRSVLLNNQSPSGRPRKKDGNRC